MFFSFIQTAPQGNTVLVGANVPLHDVKSLNLGVRTMGTATYIRIGGFASQDRSLLSVGDSISFSPNQGESTVDVLTIQIKSDTGDAIIEGLVQI